MIDPHSIDCKFRSDSICTCGVIQRHESADGASFVIEPPEASSREKDPGYRPEWAVPLE